MKDQLGFNSRKDTYILNIPIEMHETYIGWTRLHPYSVTGHITTDALCNTVIFPLNVIVTIPCCFSFGFGWKGIIFAAAA